MDGEMEVYDVNVMSDLKYSVICMYICIMYAFVCTLYNSYIATIFNKDNITVSDPQSLSSNTRIVIYFTSIMSLLIFFSNPMYNSEK